MDMKKLFMMLALSLPLMAQEVEVKEVDGKTEVTVKKQRMSDMREWKQRGDMKRGDKRMMMAKRKKMQKKRFWRSAVRVVVIGGVAYYIGYTQGQKNNHKHGWNKPKPRGEK
jgi:hypothetical protein